MALVSILDVGHGSCVSLLADDGKQWLFDCGHDGAMRPSAIFKGYTIHRLFVLNYDQDHISDLPELQRNCRIEVLTCNPSVTLHELAALKLQSGPLSDAMRELLIMRGWVGVGGFGPVIAPSTLEAENVTVTLFSNRYGTRNPELGTFADTNNISLVVFLHVHGLHMVLPGDLGRDGWRALLRNPYFRAELARVNVFVASHHGRRDGYCPEVFDYCNPEIVVMSDGEKQFETQEMTNTYAAKASGCVFDDGRTRKVLTTRSDGTIWFPTTPSRTRVEISRTTPPPSASVPFSLGMALGAPPAPPSAPSLLHQALALVPTPPAPRSFSLGQVFGAAPSTDSALSLLQALALEPAKKWR